MFYTYAIQSKEDNKLYVGYAKNLANRIKEHNSGLVRSTRTRKPFKLLYYESCNILEDAIKREKSLKTGFGRRYLKQRLSDLKV